MYDNYKKLGKFLFLLFKSNSDKRKRKQRNIFIVKY